MSDPVQLRASVGPDRLPLDRLCEIELLFTLSNQGRDAIEIYPQAAKLAAIASYAGIGISWSIALTPQNSEAPLPLFELRRWYGPPGNPPSPEYAKKLSVSLPPGGEHVERQIACWIPNAQLLPDQLEPSVLDPQGMDGITARSSFPLAQASVLVFGAPAAAMQAAMREETDFLRGHVVAFVPAAGAYDLQVGYSQSSWMGLGKTFHVRAAAVRLNVGP